MLAVNGNRWNILINFKWKQNWMDDLVGKSQKYWDKEKIKISCLSSGWTSAVAVTALTYWPAKAVVNPFALRRSWAVLVRKAAAGVHCRRSGNPSSISQTESFKLENLFPFMNSPYVTKGRTRSIKSSAVKCGCLRCLSCPKQSSHPWESFKLENLFPFMNSPYDTSGCSSF